VPDTLTERRRDGEAISGYCLEVLERNRGLNISFSNLKKTKRWNEGDWGPRGRGKGLTLRLDDVPVVVTSTLECGVCSL